MVTIRPKQEGRPIWPVSGSFERTTRFELAPFSLARRRAGVGSNVGSRSDPATREKLGNSHIVSGKFGRFQRQQTLPADATLRDARALRPKLQHEIDQGGITPPARLTVGDFLAHWLTAVSGTAGSRSTVRAYQLDARYWTVGGGLFALVVVHYLA
jgi:hypothetical protein